MSKYIRIAGRELKQSSRLEAKGGGHWCKFNPLLQDDEQIKAHIDAVEAAGFRAESAFVSDGGEVVSIWLRDCRAREYTITARLRTAGRVDWQAWLSGYLKAEIIALDVEECEVDTS